jgi:two-component system NarL family sensor kinase
MPDAPLLSDVLTWSEAARDRDHERISKVLHDETGALLTGVALQLELLRMDGVEGLEPALDALEKSFDSVRTLSRNVHPKIVERMGLVAALEALIQSSRARFSGAIVGNIYRVASSTKPSIYRMAEELLDNAIRHSAARTIELVLTSEGGLIVRDDGQGFDPKACTTGLGLLRVRFWGKRDSLRVRLRTSPELGTMFRVDPVNPCHSTSY